MAAISPSSAVIEASPVAGLARSRPPLGDSGWGRRRTVRRAGIVGALLLATGVVAQRLARAAGGLGTLPAPGLWWLTGVALAAGAFYGCTAVGLRAASGRPLPWPRTVAAQLGAAAANRVLPAGLGAAGVTVRYLQRAGMPASAAVATTGTVAVASGLSHLVAGGATVAAGVTGGRPVRVPVPPVPAVVLVGGGGAAVAAAVLLLALHAGLRRRSRAAGSQARRHVLSLLHDPGRGLVLLVAVTGAKAAQVLALAAALHAFGATVALPAVAASYLTATAVTAAAPAPGAVGTTATLVVMLTSAGAAAGVALAAVVAYVLLAYWAPALPGGLALAVGRRRGWL